MFNGRMHDHAMFIITDPYMYMCINAHNVQLHVVVVPESNLCKYFNPVIMRYCVAIQYSYS